MKGSMILEYFKAIILAGGPGSGKSYIAQKLGLQAQWV